jgi:hypothetical protein
MNIIVIKGIPFCAIDGKCRFPIIEANGFCALLAGGQATEQAQAQQSKISDRHRKKYFT